MTGIDIYFYIINLAKIYFTDDIKKWLKTTFNINYDMILCELITN